MDTFTPDEVLTFLTQLTDGTKQTTKRNRYFSLKAFFIFIKNSIDPNIQNPCDSPILRKIFQEYIKEKGIETDQRIFPITYNAARGV